MRFRHDDVSLEMQTKIMDFESKEEAPMKKVNESLFIMYHFRLIIFCELTPVGYSKNYMTFNTFALMTYLEGTNSMVLVPFSIRFHFF